MTKRLPEFAGAPCDAPTYTSLASSLPAITSMGKPNSISACAINAEAFLATRKVLVATARTCIGEKFLNRSPNRLIELSPRAKACVSKFLCRSKPAANLIESLKVSTGRN